MWVAGLDLQILSKPQFNSELQQLWLPESQKNVFSGEKTR